MGRGRDRDRERRGERDRGPPRNHVEQFPQRLLRFDQPAFINAPYLVPVAVVKENYKLKKKGDLLGPVSVEDFSSVYVIKSEMKYVVQQIWEMTKFVNPLALNAPEGSVISYERYIRNAARFHPPYVELEQATCHSVGSFVNCPVRFPRQGAEPTTRHDLFVFIIGNAEKRVVGPTEDGDAPPAKHARTEGGADGPKVDDDPAQSGSSRGSSSPSGQEGDAGEAQFD
jgi:hypothetical protein